MAYQGSESQEIGPSSGLKGKDELWENLSEEPNSSLRGSMTSEQLEWVSRTRDKISLEPEFGDYTIWIGKGSKFSPLLVEIRGPGVVHRVDMYILLDGMLHPVDNIRTSLQFGGPHYAAGQDHFKGIMVGDGGRDEINLKGIGDYSRQFGGAHYADGQGRFECDIVADGGRALKNPREFVENCFPHNIRQIVRPDAQDPFKCVIVGDGGTGKTTYVKRMLMGEFEKKYEPTMGMHEHMLDVPTKQGRTWFLCVDTPGHEKPGPPRDEYYEGADCCIIFYDITAKQTQKDVSMWHEDVHRVCGDIPMVACGNKVDLKKRQVKTKKVTFHMKKKLQYYEISAKSGYNLDSPFQYLAEKLAA